jgi:hypothetical protein
MNEKDRKDLIKKSVKTVSQRMVKIHDGMTGSNGVQLEQLECQEQLELLSQVIIYLVKM